MVIKKRLWKMAGKFNHHLFPTQKVVIKSADHLSETFFNHHLLITMGPLPIVNMGFGLVVKAHVLPNTETLPKPGCWEVGFRWISLKISMYTMIKFDTWYPMSQWLLPSTIRFFKTRECFSIKRQTHKSNHLPFIKIKFT